ncbi:hypothetical protein ACW0KB_19810 [Virgibacillus salarius]
MTKYNSAIKEPEKKDFDFGFGFGTEDANNMTAPNANEPGPNCGTSNCATTRCACKPPIAPRPPVGCVGPGSAGVGQVYTLRNSLFNA